MKPALLCIMWMCDRMLVCRRGQYACAFVCVRVGGVNICLCVCAWTCSACWHGNTAKDRRDGFWSLWRYRSSQVWARLKTLTDRTGKTGTFIKYPTEINEGKYFSVSAVQSFPRAGLWIYGEIFDDVISSWLKLWMGAGSLVSWWMKHFTQPINPH